jgi:hypothetical protein
MHPQTKLLDQNTVTTYWVRPDCAAIAPAGLDGPCRLLSEPATAATACDEEGSAGARWCVARRRYSEGRWESTSPGCPDVVRPAAVSSVAGVVS